MADTTLALVHGVLRWFQSSYKPQRNKLTGAHDAATTTFSFLYDLRGIKEGATVSVDLEECGVWSVTEQSKTATVQRGDNGSTAATHADGALVHVNPLISYFDIVAALNDELNALASPATGIWRVKTDTFTYNAGVGGYDLAADVLGVWNVVYDEPGNTQEWWPLKEWWFDDNADTTDFPSGKSLTLIDGGHPGRTVRVTYKAPFSTLSTLADVPATVTGLPVRAHQILEMGAALRLAAGRPIKRSFTESQADPKRAEETTVGDILQAPSRVEQKYQQAIVAEAARLAEVLG